MKPTFEIIKLAAKDCLKHWKIFVIFSILIRLLFSLLLQLLQSISSSPIWDVVFYTLLRMVAHNEDLATLSASSVLASVGIFLIQYGLIPLFVTLPVILYLHRQNLSKSAPFMKDWLRSAGPFTLFSLLWGLVSELIYTLFILYRFLCQFLQTAAATTSIPDYTGLCQSIGGLLFGVFLVLSPIWMFVYKMTPVIIVTEKRKTYRAMQKSYLMLVQHFVSNFWRFFKITVIFFIPTFVLSWIGDLFPLSQILFFIVTGVLEPMEFACYLHLYRGFASQRAVRLRPRLQKLSQKLK